MSRDAGFGSSWCFFLFGFGGSGAGSEPEAIVAGLEDVAVVGKPIQNALVESFNGKLRDECLNETLFTSLTHARAELAEWQHDYNTVRPHSKLGGRTPAEIAKQWKDSTSERSPPAGPALSVR